MGLCLNSVQMGLEVGAGRWRRWGRQGGEVGTRSMEYRGYPLSRIQQDVGIELGEISLNYTHFHVYREMTETAAKRLEVLGSSGYEQTNFDGVVNMSRSLDDDQMRLTLVYNGDLWAEAMMTSMGRYYTVACERMLRGLDERHAVETLLSAEEVLQQLVGWN